MHEKRLISLDTLFSLRLGVGVGNTSAESYFNLMQANWVTVAASE